MIPETANATFHNLLRVTFESSKEEEEEDEVVVSAITINDVGSKVSHFHHFIMRQILKLVCHVTTDSTQDTPTVPMFFSFDIR